MNVTYACPFCQTSNRASVAPGDAALACSGCKQEINIPSDSFEAGHLRRCLVCPSTDLFVRKDFPQRVGVALVALGVVGSSIAWAYSLLVPTFAILFATALADVVLYLIVPDELMCYRCAAEYRMVDGLERHGAFNLDTHERYRQQAARLGREQAS